MKQARKIIGLSLLLVVTLLSGYWLGTREVWGSWQEEKEVLRPKTAEGVSLDLFWEVWSKLEEGFLEKEKLDPQKMVYGAISGMVAALDDPYTVFLTPKENERSVEDLSGAFGGVGVELGYVEKQLAVMSPLAGTPAERAGLEAGDLILAVDDKEMVGVSLTEAVDLIRGKIGTKVKLKIYRQKKQVLEDVEIVREEIVLKSVEVEFKNSCRGKDCRPVAHLKLNRFGDRTESDWQAAVEEIVTKCSPQESCWGVILDVRNNPGGYLSESIAISSEFLATGTIFVEEKADGSREEVQVASPGRLVGFPLVLLINGGSASASEIVAGCLKERLAAPLVGETSFGKGSIQEPMDFGDGAGLHVTTAKWLLPSGEWVNEKGLVPDFEVENNPEKAEEDLQWAKAVEVLISRN